MRDQVILDMREGRKWNVQIALISQSLDDFDPVMVEFGTSIFIMDAVLSRQFVVQQKYLVCQKQHAWR